MGWALIRGWALINFFCLQDGRLFEVGANSRLSAYSNKYSITIVTLLFCFSLCFLHSLFGRCDSDRLFSEGSPCKLGRIPTVPSGFLYPKIII